MNQKEHLIPEGLQKIIAIKGSINLGLPEKLKDSFPNIIPVFRYVVENQKIIDPYWVSGFTNAEGCFFVKIKKSSSNRLGVQVELVFQLTQHLRDEKLINSLISYFGCGKMYKKSNVEAVDYKISKFSDLTEKLIPFFYKHKIIGVKYKDFNDLLSCG